MLLVPAAAGLFIREGALFGSADILFFLIVLGMAAGRWIDFRFGSGQSSTGEPATGQDVQRYVLLAVVGATATWLLAAWYTSRLSW
jgi:hypothetical protein